MSDDQHYMLVVDARREITALRELLEQKIKALEKVITTRLDAMDKALELSVATTTPVLDQIKSRFDDRLTFYEFDRSEVLRRLAEIERMLGEK